MSDQDTGYEATDCELLLRGLRHVLHALENYENGDRDGARSENPTNIFFYETWTDAGIPVVRVRHNRRAILLLNEVRN